MKCGIIGYGKMGKIIEQTLNKESHSVGAIADNHKELAKYANDFTKCDVAFEFSTPATASDNVKFCFDNNIPIVCGTTGWLDELSVIKVLCVENKQSMVYASNFSIGMNVFFMINDYLSKLIANTEEMYKISISESHHINKKDKPSGTALALKSIVSNHYQHSNIDIKSYRKGNIIGIHTIKYKSDVDIINVSHKALSRDAFAIGAVLAAKWLQNKKGFFEMSDVINDLTIKK